MKRLWVAVSVVALFGGILYGIFGQRKATSSTSNTASIKKGSVIQRVTVSGQVQPHRKTIIAPPYKGYVQKIFVKIGDKVRKNDPIVTISQTSQPDGGAYPLRAPFDGVVVQVFRTEGEYVEEAKDANPLVRIDNLDRFFILANVPELEVQKIKIGQETVIKLSALPEKTYKGLIREIAMSNNEKRSGFFDDNKVEYQTRIDITNPDAAVKPGLTGLIDIETSKKDDVWTLPLEYLYKAGDKYFVLTKDEKKKEVTVGAYNDEVAEIISGIKPEDRLQVIDFAVMEKQM